MRLGITIAPIPGRTASLARMAEDLGFASVRIPDSQNLAPEVWGQLMLAAQSRNPSMLRCGAYVNCVVHPDREVARDAIRGTAATFARFSAFAGSQLDRLPPQLRKTAEFLRAHYDMKHHTMTTAAHARALENEFIDWFAIAGPPEEALPRLQALADLGLDFVHAVPGSGGVAREVAITSIRLLATEVLPALRL